MFEMATGEHLLKSRMDFAAHSHAVYVIKRSSQYGRRSLVLHLYNCAFSDRLNLSVGLGGWDL